MEETQRASKAKLIASGLIPFAFLVIMIAYIFGPGAELIDFGIPLPEISIEKVDFVDSAIIATVRNTGPIPVEIVMADVNDRIQPASIEPDKKLERFEIAIVKIPFEWNPAEPYTIGLTIDDGTRFEKEIEAAAPALEPTFELAAHLALIGTYVGIIPVMIGLLWFPFIARISKNKYKFFLALTAGLLVFLGIDAIEEALEIANENLDDSFNGSLLVVTVVIISFLGLFYSGQKLVKKAENMRMTKPVAIAFMIAVGIGLHNLGEGLAIGAAIGLGQIALSTFLIVGFALHNTTEGVAIAAPMARGKLKIGRLVSFGIIAGFPAIIGTWIGGFLYSPFAAVVFLSIGAGAIFQVIISVILLAKDEGEKYFSGAAVISGFAIGLLIMYFTSILI